MALTERQKKIRDYILGNGTYKYVDYYKMRIRGVIKITEPFIPSDEGIKCSMYTRVDFPTIGKDRICLLILTDKGVWIGCKMGFSKSHVFVSYGDFEHLFHEETVEDAFGDEEMYLIAETSKGLLRFKLAHNKYIEGSKAAIFERINYESAIGIFKANGTETPKETQDIVNHWLEDVEKYNKETYHNI